MKDYTIPLDNKINRVEVIDNTGRAYTKYNVDTVQISMQDGGKTMKVFLEVKGDVK